MAVLRHKWSLLLRAAQPSLELRHTVRHRPAARHADGRHHDEGILVPVVRSWAPTNDRGMTLPEVVIAVAILTIGLLAVVGMQIGRASCRERVEVWVGESAVERKDDRCEDVMGAS